MSGILFRESLTTSLRDFRANQRVVALFSVAPVAVMMVLSPCRTGGWHRYIVLVGLAAGLDAGKVQPLPPAELAPMIIGDAGLQSPNRTRCFPSTAASTSSHPAFPTCQWSVFSLRHLTRLWARNETRRAASHKPDPQATPPQVIGATREPVSRKARPIEPPTGVGPTDARPVRSGQSPIGPSDSVRGAVPLASGFSGCPQQRSD